MTGSLAPCNTAHVSHEAVIFISPLASTVSADGGFLKLKDALFPSSPFETGSSHPLLTSTGWVFMLKACKLALTVEANKAAGIKQEAVWKEVKMLWNSCCENFDVKINPASLSARVSLSPRV